MDAVEYVKQRNRMCDYYVNCNDCPAGHYEECSSLNGVFKLVSIVEQWTKEHPAKTRQSELLKLFPETEMIDDYICICPSRFVEGYREPAQNCNMDCEKCKRDFWLKEIE
jgi:hypothetical protein|nr:MAG TPA: hypothetical protein [Caudoviricetes sp.]